MKEHAFPQARESAAGPGAAFDAVHDLQRRRGTPFRLPLLLFLLTLFTTTYVGVQAHVSFVQRSGGYSLDDILQGLLFSTAILSILIAHEMGHYLACRYYGIDATLPYLIPMPLVFGTMGAVIRIKSPFLNRKQLFDVGIAGPIAGFVVLIPVLVLGLAWSQEADLASRQGFSFSWGPPLLWQWLSPFLVPYEGTVIVHPLGMAALFGLLATSLNLLPMGQLDGGHIVYAVFGKRVHRIVSHIVFLGLVALSSLYFLSLMGVSDFSGMPAYLLFALLIRFLGFRHPPPIEEREGLDRRRLAIAGLGLVIFAVTFMPFPLRIVEH